MKPASEKSGTTPQPAGTGRERDLGHWRAGTKLSILLAPVLLLLILLFVWYLPAQQRMTQLEQQVTMSGQAMLSQIQSERRYYATAIVPKLREDERANVSEYHRLPKALPLPSPFLQDVKDMAALSPASYQVRLVSAWPINPQHGLVDDFHQEGFRLLFQDPDRIYGRRDHLSGAPVMRFLASDKAVSQSCVSCHNSHPDSPKHDFRLNDVMGGIELIIPLDASLFSSKRDQFILLAGGFSIGVLLLVVLFIGTREMVTRPLQTLTGQLQDLSRGQGDFSQAPPARSWSGFAMGEEVRNLWTQLRRMHQSVEAQQRERDRELQRKAEAHSVLNRRLLDLHQKTRSIQQAISEEDVYRILAHTFLQALPLKQIIILRLNASEDRLEVVHTAPSRPDLRPNSYPVWDRPMHCPVIRTGVEYKVQDVFQDLTCPSSLSNSEPGAYWCLPLVMGGRTIGVIHLVSTETFCWTEEAHQWIDALISVAAPMIGHLQHLERAKRRALMDELTGIYNRRFLEEFLSKTIVQGERRKGQVVSLVMMDLDRFKSVNDTYGHQVGDLVLKTVASTLHRVLKENDVLARYGGEEFTVVLPHTDEAGALSVAERLRKAVEELSFRRLSPHTPDRITMSAGVATYPTHARSVIELLRAADAALYQAKASGRNRVACAPSYAEAPQPGR